MALTVYLITLQTSFVAKGSGVSVEYQLLIGRNVSYLLTHP